NDRAAGLDDRVRDDLPAAWRAVPADDSASAADEATGPRRRAGRWALASGERDEREPVVGVHRDHQLIRTGVVAHRRGVRDILRDHFGRLAWTNPGDAAVLHA